MGTSNGTTAAPSPHPPQARALPPAAGSVTSATSAAAPGAPATRSCGRPRRSTMGSPRPAGPRPGAPMRRRARPRRRRHPAGSPPPPPEEPPMTVTRPQRHQRAPAHPRPAAGRRPHRPPGDRCGGDRRGGRRGPRGDERRRRHRRPRAPAHLRVRRHHGLPGRPRPGRPARDHRAGGGGGLGVRAGADPVCRARSGHGAVRGCAAGCRRSGHRNGPDAPDPRRRRAQPADEPAAGGDQLRRVRSGGRGQPLLRPRPLQPDRLHHRRQHRRELRRRALPEVRLHHQPHHRRASWSPPPATSSGSAAWPPTPPATTCWAPSSAPRAPWGWSPP